MNGPIPEESKARARELWGDGRKDVNPDKSFGFIYDCLVPPNRANAVFSDEVLKNIKIEAPPTGLKMYFFVMGNLSGRQQGIQAGHAALEYARIYKDCPQFKDFTENHKTFILLDGGGSDDMFTREQELNDFGIKYASFNEPDLNNSMSAIAFIVPESVYGFDWKAYEESKEFWNPVDDRNMPFRKYLKQFRLAAN